VTIFHIKDDILDKFKRFTHGEVYNNLIEWQRKGITDDYINHFYFRELNIKAGKSHSLQYNDKLETDIVTYRGVFKMSCDINPIDAARSLRAYLLSYNIKPKSYETDASKVYNTERPNKDYQLIDQCNIICIDFELKQQESMCGCIEDICAALCTNQIDLRK